METFPSTTGNYLSFMILKMKEVLVAPDLSTKIIDSPIPEADENDVVIKVVFAGSNPKVIDKCRSRIPSIVNHDRTGNIQNGKSILTTVGTISLVWFILLEKAFLNSNQEIVLQLSTE